MRLRIFYDAEHVLIIVIQAAHAEQSYRHHRGKGGWTWFLLYTRRSLSKTEVCTKNNLDTVWGNTTCVPGVTCGR